VPNGGEINLLFPDPCHCKRPTRRCPDGPVLATTRWCSRSPKRVVPDTTKGICVLFHVKCPDCGSRAVKSGMPTVADANSEFEEAIADILGASLGTEPSSSMEQVELFCLNGHKLALEEIGRQIVAQLRKEQQELLQRAS
jgi:hypothetical protein